MTVDQTYKLGQFLISQNMTMIDFVHAWIEEYGESCDEIDNLVITMNNIPIPSLSDAIEATRDL